MEGVVKPSHCRTNANSCLAEMVVAGINETAHEALKADVSRPVVLEVLAEVPPGERRRCIAYARGLADIGRRASLGIGDLRMGGDIRFGASWGPGFWSLRRMASIQTDQVLSTAVKRF